jgi:hypothetical protein
MHPCTSCISKLAFTVGLLAAAAASSPLPATATDAAVPEPSAAGVSTALATSSPAAQQSPYVDDRSGPTRLMISLVNALNRKEYVRAYSYWEPGALSHTFDQFQQGYMDTVSVRLRLGTVGGSAGAGQFYYTVPTTLIARMTDNSTKIYVGCYVLHLANPSIQGTPPFQPLAIQSADVKQVANNANTRALMAQACAKWGNPPAPPTPGAPGYRDDRSGPVRVLQSLYNAINRAEYLRAYSYWEPGALSRTFDQFQQGYSNTQSVKLTTGRVTSDAGAGQFYYSVPVTLVAFTKDNKTQTFVGCYQLHLANPSIQGTPPFQPLGIRSATIQQVANGANTMALMRHTCQSP